MANVNLTTNSQPVVTKRPPKPLASKTKTGSKPGPKAADTKQGQVLSLLEGGTTISVIMKATGWQQHSVRGFFAGVVRKKLGLNLTSKKTEAGRVYRIGSTKTAKAAKPAARKAG